MRSFSAFAIPCLIIDNWRDVGNVSKYVHKIVSYTGLPPKIIEQKYIQDHGLDKNRFSSTGKIDCGGFTATANITLSSSVITTAAHLVCDSPVPIDKCVFTYTFENETKHIPVSSQAGLGIECPWDPSKFSDWAVLKLKSPAAGPTPYKINERLVNTMDYPNNVVVAGDHSREFCVQDRKGQCVRDPKTHEFTYPKFVEECHVNGVSRINHIAVQQQTDCGAGNGTSGGTVLDEDIDHPTLVGIVSGAEASKGEVSSEKRTGKSISKPYSEDPNSPWQTLTVPVAGNFAQAILRAAAGD